ncbi:transposase [Mycoplasma sp. P36-A1]|uniref:transposase n=1 Tax=Mycoplasma sp. P36-A1 TaxID=3252900 RepID=UPI003C2E903B
MVADIFQCANDLRTFIPLMDLYKSKYKSYPQYLVGDAGYGSFENYKYCKEHNMELSLKHQKMNSKFVLKITFLMF